MESENKFRTKLNYCNDLMREISLLKGEEVQRNESARNNNIFFAAFNEYTKLIVSYSNIKKFENNPLSISDLDEIKRITKQIQKIFDSKLVNDPGRLQNAIKKLNEKLQNSWLLFSNSLTKEILDQLEILSLICNNRKVH